MTTTPAGAMPPACTFRALLLVCILCLAAPPLPAAPLPTGRSVASCALCLRLRGGARQGVEVAVPRDVESLQTAVDGAGLPESAIRVVRMMRGCHDTEQEVRVPSINGLEIFGEDSVEGHDVPDIPPSLFANASSDAGEQALLEATRRREAFQHAKLEARLVLGEGSNGVMREMHCFDPFERRDPFKAAVEVHGAPWLFHQSRLQCSEGVVVRAMRSAGVVLSECVVEGLDSDELRASICASVEDRACIRSYHSVFQDAYGAILRSTGWGGGSYTNCSVQYGGYGVAVHGTGSALLEGCFIRRFRHGGFIAWADAEAGTRITLRDCFGLEMQEWATDRRPGNLSIDAQCSFAPRVAQKNEMRGLHTWWMHTPLFKKGVERIWEEKIPTPDEISKGAEIRNEIRRTLRDQLNRNIAWLKRRRFTRRFMIEMARTTYRRVSGRNGTESESESDPVPGEGEGEGEGEGGLGGEEARVVEIDSEDELYKEDMGFITRQAPIGHLPHVIQTRQEEEDIPAEDEVVLEFDTTPLDMISGAGNRWLVGDISNSSGVDAQSSALAFVPKKPRQHVKFDSPLGRNDIWNEHHIRGPPPGRDYSPVPEAEALPGGPVLDDLRAQGGPGEGRMVEVRGIMARSADASESEGEGEGERAVVPGAGRGEDGSSEGEMEIRSESGEEGRGGEREEEKLIGSRGLVVQKEPKMQELLDAEGEPTGIEIEDQEEEPDFEELLRMLAAFPPHPDDPARLVVRDPTPGGPHIWDPLAPLARRPEGAAEEVDWDAMINARTRGAVRTAGVQRGGKREGTGGAGAGGGAAARRKVARV